jgi:hypothetical protein
MVDPIFETPQTRREGEVMMAWSLRRWAPLSEGLFDVVDDAQMGMTPGCLIQVTAARRLL